METKKDEMTDVQIAMWALSNIVASVGIQGLNKYLFTDYGFTFGIALTSFHMLATFLGIYICLQFNIFEFKKLDYSKVNKKFSFFLLFSKTYI